MVQLRTLGRLELLAGDPPAVRVLPAQPKPLAVLAYLAVASPRGPHRRDTLLTLFWPDLGEEEARRALRQTLHRVRFHLGEGLLRTERDGQIGLADGAAWCDAIAFEQALDAGRPGHALALYQGAFLDGIVVADASADFEQWVDLTRARLCRRAALAAGDLAAGARRLGDHDAEVHWATQACRLAPDDEPRLRVLMTALGDRGERAAALRAFQSFAERMAEEYAADPAAETSALADAMRAGPPLPGPCAVGVAEAVAISAAPDGVDAVGPPVEDDVSSALPAPPRSSRWRWRALSAAVLAASLALLFAARSSTAPPVQVGSILVADFRNRTRDSLLAGAVTEAVRADLSQSPLMRVMSRSQVQAVLERMRQPVADVVSDALMREVAERDGIRAFVAGEVAAIGTGFTVSAELIAVQGGEILVSVRENAADSTKLLDALDRVSAHLRRGIGESRWAIYTTPRLEQVTTPSLQALRLYSQAIRVGDQEGDQRRAVGLLQQAIALDTTFAMAYRKLGVYQGEFVERSNADRALGKAFRYRAHLPEVERLHIAATYYSSVGLADSAIAVYRALLETYPNDVRALNNLGNVYSMLKDYRRAEGYMRRALEGDSSIALLYNHLATDQLNAGELDAASQTLAARRRKFAQGEADGITASIATMRGDYASAARMADSALSAPRAGVESRTEALKMLSTLAIMRGHIADAERYRRDILDLQAREGTAADYLDAAILVAFLEIWYRHDPVRGLHTIDAAIVRYPLESMPPLDRDYALLAYMYALGGRPARARALLADIRANESVTWPTAGGLSLLDEGGYLRAQGATELAEGHYPEAVATLRRAVDLFYCPGCAVPDLARAFELADEPDSAIVQWQRYATMPWSEWHNAGGEFHASAYQRLGALHEARGDTVLAIAAYDKVAALWSGADAELQPLVADARRRAAALRAGRPGTPIPGAPARPDRSGSMPTVTRPGRGMASAPGPAH